MINAAIPMEELRAPYTVSIEKRNPEKKMRAPNIKDDSNAKCTNKESRVIMNMQTSIPFLLCFTGPGLSDMLMQSAPIDITSPADSNPKKLIIKDGTTMPAVILSPSFRKRPFIKFLYALRNCINHKSK